MTIDVRAILKGEDAFCRPSESLTPFVFVERSDNGYVRGLWRVCSQPSNPVGDPTFKTFVLRFTIDASQGRCTGVLSELFPSEWYRVDDSCYFMEFFLDCVQEELWYQRGPGNLPIVVDFE